MSLPREHPSEMASWNSSGVMQFLIDASPEKKQRQNYPKYYFVNGAIYIFTLQLFIKNHSRFDKNTIKYIMPPLNSIDLDSEDD